METGVDGQIQLIAASAHQFDEDGGIAACLLLPASLG